MLKRIILLYIICSLISGICKSQNYKFIYYLDVNLVTVPKSQAEIIGKGFYDKNSFQLDCYAAVNNDFLMTWHFTDSTLAELNGLFRSYSVKGKIEKEGNYIKGVEEGLWQEWDSTGMKTDSIIYKHGLPYIEATFNYHKNGKLADYTLKDSLQNTYQAFSYNEKSELTKQVSFKGEKGILKRYSSTGTETDSLFTRAETEAHFPGGDDAWLNYLRKNLNALVPANNNAPSGKYTVIIKFRVSKDGTLQDIYPETYHRYGMEVEAIRVIMNGPKWVPATQYGYKVNSYRRQPVTFLIEN